jgi:hypothetical protein
VVDLADYTADDLAHLAAIWREHERCRAEERTASTAELLEASALGTYRSGTPAELSPETPPCPPPSAQPWTPAELVAAGRAVAADRPWTAAAVSALVDIGVAERIPSPYIVAAVTAALEGRPR